MNTITHPCLICGNESEYSIPGMTRELYFCAKCIVESRQIPAEIMSTIIRDVSPDTISFLLSLIAKNEILLDRVAAQETLIKELKIATGYNIMETMRSDRDNLADEVSKLTSLLSEKEAAYNKLLSESKSFNELKSDLTKLCSEFLDTSIERLIATTKKNTAILHDGQKDIISSLSEVLTAIKQLQVDVPSPPKPLEIPPKRRVQSKEHHEEQELSIEDLEDGKETGGI